MEQSSILIGACRNNETEKAEQIVELYPSLVSRPDIQGWLPIHHAVLNRNVHLIDILVKHGGDLHALTPSKWTCLHFAAFHGDIATLEYLISKGVDINAVNDRGWTALHIMAVKNNKVGISYLLTHGADPSIQNKKGETPLQVSLNKPKLIV